MNELNNAGTLRFDPIYKDYIWGGTRIAERYGRAGTPKCCAESWEISAHPDGPSRVADGPLAGETLAALTERFGRELLGRRAPEERRFPLLFKLIDAHDKLSVQVHPSPADPAADPAEYKNECWHCLDTEDGSRIYAGFLPSFASKAAVEAALTGGGAAIHHALLWHVPHPGETLYIPAGLCHAIGAGNLIYEVQQNSNTTYRLYDWGRRMADGTTRPIHKKKGLRSLDLSLPEPAFQAPKQEVGSALLLCLKTPYFTIREHRGDSGAAELAPGGETFHALFVKAGAYRVETAEGAAATLRAGDSALVPACQKRYRLAPLEAGAAALVTTVGEE